MDKKIDLLHVYYQEGNLGDSIRINEMSKWLKKKTNYTALNIAFNPRYLFHLKNLNALKSLLASGSVELAKNKIFIERCRRAINKKIKGGRYQLILAEMDLLAAAALLSEHQEAQIAADIHGIESAQYIEDQYISNKNKKYYFFLKKIEKFVFENSDYLLCVSGRMRDFIVKNYQPEGEILVAPNGTTKTKIRAKFHHPLKIIYGGIFAFWEDLDTYLDLAKIDSRNKYFLMGDGPEKKRILNRIKEEKIKIKYLGSKKREEAHKIFGQMSVGVAPTSSGVTRRVASPIKVYDYMSFGLPVITAECGDWGDEIKKFGAGSVCRQSRADEFIQAIKELEKKSIWQEKSKSAVLLAAASQWQQIFNRNSELINQKYAHQRSALV